MTKATLIIETENFTVIQLHENVKRYLYASYYLKNEMGFWYRTDFRYGVMYRQKYIAQKTKLDEILAELGVESG